MENLSKKLTMLDKVPEALITIDPRDLHTIMPNPTLIHLKSPHNEAPLFMSTLLHGNETTGFYALQRILKKYCFGDTPLPRDFIIFLGNVDAAKNFQRRLDNQVDFNRIWAGGSSPEQQLAESVLAYVKQKKPFAALDIHNNTGHNPFYACVNNLQPASLHLAKMFSNQVVYFTKPETALTISLNKFTTAVTIESGRSGELSGVERVYHYIDQILHLDKLDTSTLNDSDVCVYHSIARITVPKSVSICFDKQPNPNCDFTFPDTIEHMNFIELAENSCIGWRHHPDHRLIVTSEQGEDLSQQFFRYDDNEVRIKRPIIPAMFCTSEKIIHQDCFGYIMQRYTIE